MTATTPGTHSPCTKRHAIKVRKLVAVPQSMVAAVSRNSDGTMTRLRPLRSASAPTKGPISATAKITALTVKLTPSSLAWKILRKYGNRGCVLYTLKNVHMPATITAIIVRSSGTDGAAAWRLLEDIQ